MTNLTNRPAWIDLSTSDAAAAREFYGKLLGWQIDVSPDPQYGGYGMATRDGVGVAGIGPKMDPKAPSAWTLYIGSDDVDALAGKIGDAGGRVLMQPFDVGDQGRMAMFLDPAGAVFAAWQATQMRGFVVDEPNAFGWAELNARDVEDDLPFYEQVFGWTRKTSHFDANQPPYNEFQIDGQSILGAFEMNPHMPAGVPGYWQVYFNVDDVDAAYERAIELGASEMLSPQDFPGGRFAILSDPQGASFAVMKNVPDSR